MTAGRARAQEGAQQAAEQSAPPRAGQPLSLSIRADNDAFDFWEAPFQRPDQEYTSGVRITLEVSGGAPWERWFHRVAPCALGVAPCATHTLAFGQDIYTGELVPGDTTSEPGTRPNAGWLYLQESSRFERTNRLDETSVTVGVTGAAALGGVTQQFVHGIAPAYNRPINWSTQLPFEPGVVLAWDHTERIFAVGDGKLFGADVEPHAGASFGNILTEGRAGLSVRTGFRMQHPWLVPAIDSSDTTPAISFFADAMVHGVVRNEFLAGTMFRASEHVEERPFVSEYQVGVTLRLEQVSLSWVAHQLSSEYYSRADGHAWSRIEVVYRYVR
jgi:lipid A 3-O-deacylase